MEQERAWGEREREREREIQIYIPLFLRTESILAGVQSMNVITTSTNEIAINFTISENIMCLVQRERLIIAHICYANTTCDPAEHEFVPTNCQNQSVGESVVKFQDLLADSAYCIRADISYGNAIRVLPNHTLYTHATATTERIESTTSGRYTYRNNSIVYIDARVLGTCIGYMHDVPVNCFSLHVWILHLTVT